MTTDQPSKRNRLAQAVSLDLASEKTTILSGGSPESRREVAKHAAQLLKAPLHRHSLSKIIGKYIGETEKNLKRVFAEAEACNAILLFDEADALFGKRGEVQDSHDRYASLEAAWNLINAYSGPLLISTNQVTENDDRKSVCWHAVEKE